MDKRKLLVLITAIVFIALTGVANQAQQTSSATAPAIEVCRVGRSSASLQSQRQAKITRGGQARINLEEMDSKRRKLICEQVAVATERESSAAPPIQLSSDRRHSGLHNFALLAAKPISKPAGGNVLGAESTQDPGQPQAANEAQELAKKLSNPVASLISFPMQSNFDFGMGAGSGWRYTLNVQPVIPIALSPKWNMISRTIIPIIHQGNVTGPNQSQSGLGDTVQSLFFSPNKTEPFIWAVGPVVLLPTATNASLGAQKWGLGPTALALKQKKGWTYGVLANHIWSVAGKSNRADVSATFIQPFLSYSTKDAWTYSLNTESTYDWNGKSWSIPINPFISKLVRFGKQPVSFGGGLKCWVTTPTGGPEGCGLRIVVTALFPKK